MDAKKTTGAVATDENVAIREKCVVIHNYRKQKLSIDVYRSNVDGTLYINLDSSANGSTTLKPDETVVWEEVEGGDFFPEKQKIEASQ